VLMPDERLDADIEQIGNASRAWILGRNSGNFGRLAIDLFGPMDGMSRTPTPGSTYSPSSKASTIVSGSTLKLSPCARCGLPPASNGYNLET